MDGSEEDEMDNDVDESMSERSDESDYDHDYDDESFSEDTSDYSYPSDSGSKSAEHPTKIKLLNTAIECDRYLISDRSAGAFASAVLKDCGLLDSENVIDKNKIRRARKRVRAKAVAKISNLRGIWFDGRMDDTLTVREIEGRHYKRTIKEKHITIVAEPHSIFLGHTIVGDSTSLTISNRIVEHLGSKSIRTDPLAAVGTDGEVTNTGTGDTGGVIIRIETFLNRPLNWFICMLHLNELPFRHLFIKLDGTTTGPYSFNGPLGKKTKNLQ